MNNKIIYAIMLNLLLSFPDCENGIPTWQSDYESVPFDNEFSATIAAAQIFIDGVEQTDGKIAAFGQDGIISALDNDGSSFFPPAETNVYELSIWSNSSGEIMTFKYYDVVNDVVIDLNESYTFVINDVIGDGFSPFQLTGNFPNCDEGPCDDVDEDDICDDVDDCVGEYDECGVCNGDGVDCEFEDLNHFSDIVDTTGISMAIIFEPSNISELDEGDEIGIFDYMGRISEGEECLNLNGEALVGFYEFNVSDSVQAAWKHFDACDFPDGYEKPGFIDGNPIKLKIWDVSENREYEALYTLSSGVPTFQEVTFISISEICELSDLPENACDCEGTIFDCEGICGGDGEDADADGICDDIDDCVGEYDCEGNCNGGLVVDDCGICDGNNADQDCNGDCFGDAVVDECGICNGFGATHQCWDGQIVCTPFDCEESNLLPPDLFTFNSSTNQAFYFINQVSINNINLDDEDWLAAFNGDICVGSRNWDTNFCNNGICDIPVMGSDGSEQTEGYMLNGDFPSFKIYDFSEDIYYNTATTENFQFEINETFVIDSINESDYLCNDNLSCRGCMSNDACNYDIDALIEDECFYIETQLIEPINNEIIEMELGDTLNFSWSLIDQSCMIDNYKINIYNLNEGVWYSNILSENNISVAVMDLEVLPGEITTLTWNISTIEDVVISDTFAFYLEIASLNISNLIDNFRLNQNFPNPFNPQTCIEFQIFKSDFIEIKIYDVQGNIINNLLASYYNPGIHKVYWDATQYPSGIYFYEISNSKDLIRKKMMLIK
tara:strand:- start:140 stop:2485 length:2346 start_codon:yes stop_codon:yes gene_type:complete